MQEIYDCVVGPKSMTLGLSAKLGSIKFRLSPAEGQSPSEMSKQTGH